MKTKISLRNISLAAVVAALLPSAALAFPPAPHHTLFGTVRDQFGNPLSDTTIQIQLQTPAGSMLKTTVTPNVAPGVNYQLEVPMDAGITADLYENSALMATAAFKMYVIIGTVTNVPFQMLGDYSHLGQPSKMTRMDLTLGQDLNGDGLPDAWEYALLAALGGNLSSLTANADSDHDGMSNWAEFIAGTYAFDPGDSLTVRLVSLTGDSPLLEFLAITGRTYTVLGSSDLKSWNSVSLQVPSDGASAATRPNLFATSTVNHQQVQVLQPASGPTLHFFKLMVQ